MSDAQASKLLPVPPVELCRRRGIPFGDETAELQASRCTPPQFLRWLVEGGHHVDAIRYLAHALPHREAVWWACLSARRALGGEPPEEDLAALEAAEAWVHQPDDAHRRAAMQAAEHTAMDSAASFAAVAAFFAEGSINPPDMPPLAPPEHLTGTMVTSAVLSAGAVGKAERAAERYKLLLQMGMDIARA